MTDPREIETDIASMHFQRMDHEIYDGHENQRESGMEERIAQIKEIIDVHFNSHDSYSLDCAREIAALPRIIRRVERVPFSIPDDDHAPAEDAVEAAAQAGYEAVYPTSFLKQASDGTQEVWRVAMRAALASAPAQAPKQAEAQEALPELALSEVAVAAIKKTIANLENRVFCSEDWILLGALCDTAIAAHTYKAALEAKSLAYESAAAARGSAMAALEVERAAKLDAERRCRLAIHESEGRLAAERAARIREVETLRAEKDAWIKGLERDLAAERAQANGRSALARANEIHLAEALAAKERAERRADDTGALAAREWQTYQAKLAEALAAKERAETELQAERTAHANTMMMASSEYHRLTSALESIARQKLQTEMDEEARESGDYEGAYDTMIEVARRALPAAPAQEAK